jgi:hypothetical protein
MSGVIYPPLNSNTSSWGGNIVQLKNDTRYHLYVSEFVNHCGLSSWQLNSQIRHAVSDTLAGPYFPKDVVLLPFAHNANPIVLPSHVGAAANHVAVFHVGGGSQKGNPMQCVNGTTPQSNFKTEKGCKNVTSGGKDPLNIPHSATGAGPWETANLTCVHHDASSGKETVGGCPHLSNAAPLVLPNGTTLIIHSGCPGSQGEGLNLAIAPHWTGPFRPMRGFDNGNASWYSPSIDTTSKALESNGCTDPYIWLDGQSNFHALFHCHYGVGRPEGIGGDLGGHAFSADGVTWTTSAELPFNETVAIVGGTTITFDARQRPHLVMDTAQGIGGASPSGNPMALSLGLKVYTRDPEGGASSPWMKQCKACGQAGCDLTATQLQPLGTS